MRQKMRSECRVLLVHCVVAIVLSPGCMCCTGFRGKQIQQSARKRGSERGRKLRQKMKSECRVLLVHCVVAIVLSPGCMCCTRFRGKQIKQSASKRGSERGRKLRQKMRSECRVLLVHCVVTTVFSPGCMCCTGFRGKQTHQRKCKSGSKIGMKMRQKMRSECRVPKQSGC